jgi:hypothetical protein
MVVFSPTQIPLGPVKVIVGLLITSKGKDWLETQPELFSVKVNVAEPIPIPVTNPLVVIVAMAGSLLVHIPPELGLRLVVPLIQISSAPSNVIEGAAKTVKGVVGLEVHPVEAFVNTNDVEP